MPATMLESRNALKTRRVRRTWREEQARRPRPYEGVVGIRAGLPALMCQLKKVSTLFGISVNPNVIGIVLYLVSLNAIRGMPNGIHTVDLARLALIW